jgi:hypothetical protein
MAYLGFSAQITSPPKGSRLSHGGGVAEWLEKFRVTRADAKQYAAKRGFLRPLPPFLH